MLYIECVLHFLKAFFEDNMPSEIAVLQINVHSQSDFYEAKIFYSTKSMSYRRKFSFILAFYILVGRFWTGLTLL